MKLDFPCPKCGDTNGRTIDSRSIENGRARRRRKLCSKCGMRFSTREEIDRRTVKFVCRDGIREWFNLDRIRGDLDRSCANLPLSSVSINDIDAAATAIESEVHDGRREVGSDEIRSMVEDKLLVIHPVAYVRFKMDHCQGVWDILQIMAEFIGS